MNNYVAYFGNIIKNNNYLHVNFLSINYSHKYLNKYVIKKILCWW